MRSARWILLLALFGAAFGRAGADEEHDGRDYVKLRDGRVRYGTVVDREKTPDGRTWLLVETAWGFERIEQRAVAKSPKPRRRDPDATFIVYGVRIVSFFPVVEIKPVGGESWKELSWSDPYQGEIENVENALITPGTLIRTKAKGQLDLMVHKDAWIRLRENTEVLIPEPGTDDASLRLKNGGIDVEVQANPHGAMFRIRTPLTELALPRGGTLELELEAQAESVKVGRGEAILERRRRVRAGEKARWTADEFQKGRQTKQERQRFDTLQAPRLPLSNQVLIQAGRYWVGGPLTAEPPWTSWIRNPSLKDESDKHFWTTDSESPPFEIDVPAFMIDIREVTEGELQDYRRSLQRDPEPPPVDADDLRAPAHGITRDEAVAFARWAGKRLMTGVQYEVAARGRGKPADFPYPWGDKVKRHHRELLAGSWAWENGTWIPPHSLPPVDRETADVSYFLGIRALVSGVPEWTRNYFRDAPFYERMKGLDGPRADRLAAAKPRPVVRGHACQLVARGVAHDTAGLRLVVEIEDEDDK